MTYPVDYPFEDMPLFINKCKDIVRFFHNHHVIKTQFKEMQRASDAQSLVYPCPTCWSTIEQTCKTLLTSEQHIHVIVSARDFMKGMVVQVKECTKVKETITNQKFVDLVKKTIAILESLYILIVKYQSKKVPISEVMPNIHALSLEFLKLLAANIIKEYELDYLIKTCVSRLMFMYCNTQDLTYMLDPRFIAEGMMRQNCEALEDIMFRFLVHDESRDSVNEVRAQIIFKQYTEFVIAAIKAKQEKSMRYRMLLKNHKKVLQYWLIDGKYCPELQRWTSSSSACRLLVPLRNAIDPLWGLFILN